MKATRTVCAACGRVFEGTKAFDDHRKGSYERSATGSQRYCVDVDGNRIAAKSGKRSK
jgi:hypothetical protein